MPAGAPPLEGGENSFYKILNEALRSENRPALRPWFSYLKLLDVALKKLPIVRGNVWRGVPGDISEKFTKGRVLTWWGISSCSQEMDVVQGFLDPNGSSTLFMIEAITGKDASKYSYFSNESEVMREMTFEVEDVISEFATKNVANYTLLKPLIIIILSLCK